MSPSGEDIEKINAFTVSPFDGEELYVFSVALCNNDIDRDNEKFSLEALKQLAGLFPGKTGICDHSMRSADQKARIFDAFVEKVDGRKTADGEDFYQLRAKAYMVRSEENLPLIREIEAGIKKEVSVSCAAAKCTCSVCGKDKRSGKCSHIGGRVYNGKRAFSVLSDITDAYEFSFVAVPAQREAGVTKGFASEKETVDTQEIIGTIKSCRQQTVMSQAQCEALADYIDSLEADAQLGREYKKNLANEVVKLCAVAMPEMDIKAFGNVAQIMTHSELLCFKKAFEKSQGSNHGSVQIKGSTEKKQFNEFRI